MPESPLPPASTVAAYYRDSGGPEQERSVDQQRAAASEYCRQHGLVLVREFADEASPGSSIIGRDQFQAMVAWLRELAPEPERGKRLADAPDAVLCWDMKRFARDDRDSAFFRADLRRRGYALLFLSDRIPSGDMAPVFEAMLSWKAKQDLEELAKDVRRGMRSRVLAMGVDGRYLNLWPSNVPLGFRAEPWQLGQTRDGRPRTVQRLIPDKGGTWERIQRAFELRA
nr:recombinase family protein [Anaerolineae bacterium]